jgi:hypothetical protein
MMKIIFSISIKQPFFPYHIWEEYVNLFMEKNMGTQKKYLNFPKFTVAAGFGLRVRDPRS